MGKASISIAISALWQGQPAIDKAISDITRLDRRMALQDSSVTQSIALSGAKWQQLGQDIYDAGQRMAEVGDTLTQRVTAPMAQLGSYGVEKAVEFDTAVANLRKTSDMSADALDRMAQSALDMSTTQPVDAATILNVEALGAQLGVADESLQSFAETVTGLDIATNMDADTAATEMARFANIVGMAEDEFDNYGSTIVAIGNNMATTESEVSNMAQRFASAGHQAGLSEAEILGMSAAMSSLGIKSEMGGSALSQVFVSISKAVSMGGDSLEAFAEASNMSAEEFAAAWRDDAAGAFESLLQGIHDASEAGEDMNVILSDLEITQIRQSDVMRRMAGSVDTVSDALDLSTEAWEQNTALTDEVAARNESMQSQFDVLRNKVDAIAITVGTPLANALISLIDLADPLVQGVADAAQAFADMDEEGQRNVIALAGVAAAAGPVLSVAGRLTQGVGNLVTAFGKAQSAVSVYGDAMATLDGAHMRVYSSSDTLSSKLGIARNAAAEAAGGVDSYVRSWEKMYDAARRAKSSSEQLVGVEERLRDATGKTRERLEAKKEALERNVRAAQEDFEASGKLVSQWGRSTTEAERYAKGVKALDKPLASVRDSMGDVQSASKKTSAALGDVATKAASSGASFASTAGSFAKNAASMAGALLAQAGPLVAIALVTTAVGALVAKYQEAEEHSNLLAEATQSAGDVMGAARGSAEGLGDAIGDVSSNAEKTLESMRDLNDSVSETFVAVEQDQAKLDQYVSVIGELANKSDLSATEQWKLSQAVEGYNEVVGTQYSVVDAASGKIADQDGVLQENTDQINANAEAWRQRATAQAYSNLATQYLEAEAEASYNLKVAQEQLATAQERQAEIQEELNRGVYDNHREFMELQDTIPQLEQDVSDLTAAQQTAAESFAYFSDMADIAASSLSDNLKNALQGLPQSMSDTGLAVANSLAAGIQAGSVSAEDAARFVADGVSGAIAGMPESTRAFGEEAATAVAQALANGQVDVTTATQLLKDCAGRNLSTWGVMFSNAGVEMPQQLSAAIAANQALPADATQAMKDAVYLVLANGDTEVAAQMLGHDIDEGLADGIKNGTLSEEEAALLGEAVIAKARESLDSHSPSLAFADIGSDVDAGLEQGISGNTSGPLDAMGALGRSLVDSLSGLPGEMRGAGGEASSGLAGGIGSGEGDVRGSAGRLRDAAETAKDFGSPWSWGSDLASNFAEGIRAGIGWVSDAAKAIANAAQDILHFSVPEDGPWSGTERGGYTSGTHLAENWARGIRAGAPLVASAARSLSLAAEAPLSRPVGAAGADGARTGAAPVTYNVYIDGARLQSASGHARELIAELVGELTSTTEMGVR